MTEAVKIRGLVKNYNGLVAVNNLDLTVPEGSIYGFLGPNGAGKTTTLKMIAGMTEPTSGEIEIMGKKVSFGSNQNREMIGYLPDVPGFYDWMSPVEFLNFSGSLYNIEKSVLKSRIVELLKLVNLYKQRSKKIGTFSRGMKQRLGIAQALINDPKVVLLDEPVSALDPIGRKEVMDIISSLSAKVTVFFSSHILADVERICDRVVIINEGKKLLEDSIEHIREVPDVRELEIELETKEDVLKLEAIKDLDFVEEVVVDNLKVLIKAQDIDKLRVKLNQIFNEENILVKKMVVKEISLEDIFIKVVNNHDQA
ncbi:MAG: ABC transporter ATP-binding protein [Tenericutes bacterium HGW-Tenericutes-5]|nr:MAG: ABC transporter ATP-binding protein [Tenericutes bacterium HGW-Tenericutes-5]